jgi:hypothetical protein
MRSATPDLSTKKQGLPTQGDPTEPEEKLRYSTSPRENEQHKNKMQREIFH